MSQFDFGNIDPSTKSGTQLASDLNDDRDAMQSQHKGSAAPSYKKSGMFWMDDSANPIWVLKMWDGTDWIQILTVDTTNNICTADTDRIFTNLGPAISITSAGTANNYTGSISPAPSSLVANTFLFVTWNVANTGSSQLNLNGLGAKTIKLPDGSTLAGGDLPLNGTSLLFYNGTDLILMSGAFFPKATRDLDMQGFAILRSGFKQATDQSGSGAIACNYANGNYFKVTATGNVTLTLTNLPSSNGASIILQAVNFGAYTITWPSGIKWDGGAAPSMTAAGTDFVSIIKDAGGQLYGFRSATAVA